MASDWRDSTWGEEISLEYGKRLVDYSDRTGPVRVYGTNGPVGWTDKALSIGPGVIVGRKGAYRGVHFSRDPFFVIDTAYYAVPKRDLDIRWLYYAILHHKLGELDDGSPIPSTTRTAVYVRDLRVPPKHVQQDVAEFLGTLDDKIELNRRMNGLLKGMARAIFKGWFIDFAPVKAKASGATNFSGMPQSVFDQLPNSFIDSELGEIPKGWEVRRWGDIATLQYGKSLKGYKEGGGSIRVWGTNGPIGWHTTAICATAGIIIGRKGAYRGVHYSPDPFFVIDTAFYLQPKHPIDLLWAYYELLEFDINNMDSGSAIPSTSREDFYAIPVRFPASFMQHAFGNVLASLLELCYAHEQENEILSQIRDTLLPKLMSGELTVPTHNGGNDAS